MAVKRGLEGRDGNPEFQETQQQNQRFKFTKCLYKDEWLQKFSAQLENLVRKVVREESEQAVLRHLQSIPRSLPNGAELSQFRKFKLHFEGQLPRRLYTGNSIETEGPLPLKVLLVDAKSGHVVTDGPLSSAKVEIVALHGHFKTELLEHWTQKEFNDNIVPARDGRRPLLVGERVIVLCSGVGFINGISFTDNSSWERSKMFRLGVKIDVKLAKEDQVREAVSTPFEVKDRRGETYQKHNTPSLEDEVWRLKGIAKDGKICKRLADHQIYKVKDILQMYHIDQSLLRNILCVRPKMWERIVQQVALCFSNNVYPNLSALAPSHICSEPVSTNTDSSLHLDLFSAPGANQDQPEVHISYTHGTSHELDHYMAPNQDSGVDNNPLIEDSLAGLCNDEQSLSLGYNMAPSSHSGLFNGHDMFNFPATNWVSISQLTGEEENPSFWGASSNFPIGIFSSITNLGASTSEMASSKAGWSKLRAKWRILV